MLEEALKEDNFAVLPGRGKPLDLKKYFASGPEHRVALKLLKDNQVLPQSLQERKEAGQLTLAARAYIDRERENLAVLYSGIPQTATRITKVFPNRHSLLDLLSMDALPPYLPEPAATLPPARQQLLRDAGTCSKKSQRTTAAWKSFSPTISICSNRPITVSAGCTPR